MAEREELSRNWAILIAVASGVVVFAVLTAVSLVVVTVVGLVTPDKQVAEAPAEPPKPEVPTSVWESPRPRRPARKGPKPRHNTPHKPRDKRPQGKPAKPNPPRPPESDRPRRVAPSGKVSKFIDGEIMPFDPKMLEPTEEDIRAYAAAVAAERAAAAAEAAEAAAEAAEAREHPPAPKNHTATAGHFKILKKTGGTTKNQRMTGFSTGTWHNGDQLWWTGAKPGDRLEIAVPVEEDGRYKVSVILTKAPDYGVVQLYIDGKKGGQPIDLHHTTVTNSPPISLGRHKLSQGQHTLGVEIVEADKPRKRHFFGLDRIVLRPAE